MTAILCCSEKTLELHLKVCLHIDKILLNIVLDYEREWRHIMIDGDLPPGENTWATCLVGSHQNHYPVPGKVALVCY